MSKPRDTPGSSPTLPDAGAPKNGHNAVPFHYEHDLFCQFLQYVCASNHHGVALMARQKGVPPFLRFKAWPVLLKRHPFVANPFIQPDSFDKDKSSSDSDSDEFETHLQHKIRKDLRRYMHRIAYSSAEEPLSQTESQLFDIVESSVLKFVVKWGKIIKYDSALTWIALGLAEWFPPIPHTPWVLLGRDYSSDQHTCVGSVFKDYEEYIDSHPGLREQLDAMVEDKQATSMKFHEVFERLALVLLHSPESANKRSKRDSQALKIDKSTLPVSGGTIEERVSFFIYVFQKMLPELSQYFQEEEILNKFGSHDDEWVLWWLKYCGSKVWSRVDRGRVWDLMVGWRPQSKKAEWDQSYYAKKIGVSDEILSKLGPDAFWSVDYEDEQRLQKDDSFCDLINDLHVDSSKVVSSPSSSPSSVSADVLSDATSTGSADDLRPPIPFCKVDPHIELLFVSLSLLKAKENTLVELDQHEIRTFLSRLPAKSYKRSDKYKQYQEQKDKERGSTEGHSKSDYGLRYDYMDSVINEAGELWRKWLWSELSGDS